MQERDDYATKSYSWRALFSSNAVPTNSSATDSHSASNRAEDSVSDCETDGNDMADCGFGDQSGKPPATVTVAL